MKLYILVFVLLISVFLFFLIFSQCAMGNNKDSQTDNRKLYYWEPTASSPKKNPVEREDVCYFFENGSSLSVFGSTLMGSGMGWSKCDADYGPDWKVELPTAVGAKWISFAERKAYVVYEDLPVDQLKTLFENGYESFDEDGNPERGEYKELCLCLLPGGEVVLFVCGDKRKILLDWSAQGEWTQNFDLFDHEGSKSKTLEEYIENDIKSNPFLNVPQVVTPELLHKYFERFNYKIKVRFEDDKSSMWWFNYEYSNSEVSIAYFRDEDSSIKYPSRMKYFRTIWRVNDYQYIAYFYFNEEEVIRVFDEAYGDDRKQSGVLDIFVSKYNNLFEISLTVNGKKYLFEKTEIRVFRDPLSDLSGESELVYKNYEGENKNVFIGE